MAASCRRARARDLADAEHLNIAVHRTACLTNALKSLAGYSQQQIWRTPKPPCQTQPNQAYRIRHSLARSTTFGSMWSLSFAMPAEGDSYRVARGSLFRAISERRPRGQCTGEELSSTSPLPPPPSRACYSSGRYEVQASLRSPTSAKWKYEFVHIPVVSGKQSNVTRTTSTVRTGEPHSLRNPGDADEPGGAQSCHNSETPEVENCSDTSCCLPRLSKHGLPAEILRVTPANERWGVPIHPSKSRSASASRARKTCAPPIPWPSVFRLVCPCPVILQLTLRHICWVQGRDAQRRFRATPKDSGAQGRPMREQPLAFESRRRGASARRGKGGASKAREKARSGGLGRGAGQLCCSTRRRCGIAASGGACEGNLCCQRSELPSSPPMRQTIKPTSLSPSPEITQGPGCEWAVLGGRWRSKRRSRRRKSLSRGRRWPKLGRVGPNEAKHLSQPVARSQLTMLMLWRALASPVGENPGKTCADTLGPKACGGRLVCAGTQERELVSGGPRMS